MPDWPRLRLLRGLPRSSPGTGARGPPARWRRTTISGSR